MGYATSIIADNSVSGITYTRIPVTGKYLVGVGVAEFGTGDNELDFRASVYLTVGGGYQSNIVAGLCQGMVGPGMCLGWTGKIRVHDDMQVVCFTRGNTSDNAYVGCITEDE